MSSLLFSEEFVVLVSITVLYFIAWIIVEKRKDLAEKWGLSLDGLTIMLKTERLNTFIERCGLKYSKFFRFIGDIGIVVGILLSIYGIYFLHMNLLSLVYRTPTASPVTPIIPGITIGLSAIPYFAIAAFIVLLPHELMHAFVAAAEKIKVKSTGVFLLFVIPGGFAEIDEEELENRSFRSQARVFSAGSLANIATFAIIALLMPLLIYPTGVIVQDTLQGYPAENVLKPGDILVEINGEPVRTITDLGKILSKYGPGERVSLTVIRRGEKIYISIVLASNPTNSSRGFIGAYFTQAMNNPMLFNAFWWSAVATSSVAIINMLPIYPLDGGRVMESFFRKVLKREKIARITTYALTLYFAGILISNMILSFSLFGLRPFP